MGWADGRLCGFDVETTGAQAEDARIVSVSLVFAGGGQPTEVVHALVDPGVEVPDEAAAVHGITTARARAEGAAPAEVLQMVANRLGGTWGSGRPVIGFNVGFDLTVLDREMRRHLGGGLAVTGPVIDPHVIDRALDRRKGRRTLAETCAHYAVRHDGAHDAAQDALAAARLAWRLARRYPAEVGEVDPAELHGRQIDWARQWAERLNAYWASRSVDRSVDGLWPIRPCPVDGPGDREVLDAVRRKLLADWEQAVRERGPQPFRTELHVVNDTRAAHPYFTTVRCRRYDHGPDAASSIALMGLVANVLAADRVAVAWDVPTLEQALWAPGTPQPGPAPHELVVADVAGATTTRVTRHPFTMPDGPGEVVWGRASAAAEEPLPEVVRDMLRLWRRPMRRPQGEFRLRQDFQKAGYEFDEAIRPRRR